MNIDLQNLLDRQAIAELLARYCHAIDRLDREMLTSVYWPDATDDHVTFKGTASEFIEFVMKFLEPMTTQHSISNSLVEFDSQNQARGVTYVTAFHRIKTLFAAEDLIVGARYFDQFEKRAGEWRLKDRILSIDYARHGAATNMTRYDGIENAGGHYPNDPYYRLFRGKPSA
jgi:hypothetical protein